MSFNYGWYVMKRHFKKKLIFSSTLLFLMSNFPTLSYASDFQSPFINVSDLGNAYAGWAALAEDASTAYSNPAGLTRLQHYQLVLPFVWINGSAIFNGTTKTPPFPFPVTKTESGFARTRIEAFLPSFYFAAPVTRRLTFAFSQNTPFGLASYYGDSIVRYLSTKVKIAVLDVGPSVGFKVTDTFSVGAGFDAHNLHFALDQKIGPPLSFPLDSATRNDVRGWGYGWHAGALYQFLPCFRVGLSFNSKSWVHAKGDSILDVPFPRAIFKSSLLKVDAPLPARAQLGFHYDINPAWAVLGTVFYTHWSVFDKLTLQNMVIFGGETVDTNIPLEYRDTFDYSAAVNYKPTQKLILRTGVQFLDTPVKEQFHSPANPSSSALILAVGLHYIQDCHISYDIGYGHAFFDRAKVNVVTPLTSAVGTVKARTDVIGVQLNWNID